MPFDPAPSDADWIEGWTYNSGTGVITVSDDGLFGEFKPSATVIDGSTGNVLEIMRCFILGMKQKFDEAAEGEGPTALTITERLRINRTTGHVIQRLILDFDINPVLSAATP